MIIMEPRLFDSPLLLRKRLIRAVQLFRISHRDDDNDTDDNDENDNDIRGTANRIKTNS